MQTELETAVHDALAEARKQGATQAESAVSLGSGISVVVRRGEVETLEHHRKRQLAVTVYAGQRKGSASSSDWSRGAIVEAVTAARDIARYSAEDPCVGLADSDRLASEVADLDLYHPWKLSAEAAIQEAAESEAAAFGADPAISNSEGATVASLVNMTAYGNSHGFYGSVARTRHSRGCSVIASRDDEMQRGYWSDTSRDASVLESPRFVGEEAGARAKARLGSARLGTRTCPVLFRADLSRGLLGHLVAAVSGGSLYRKASFLLDSLGKQILPAWLSLREEPHLLGALGSTAFDREGVATTPRDLVKDGVLAGYVLESYAARRLKMKTTGNAGGIHNLLPSGGEQTFEELLETMGRGLLVTGLMGQGVNLVTGDYSRGANGFWVENGRIQYPVEEITIAGNLADMFAGIAAMGADVDRRGVIQTGSILIEQMTVAGN